MADVLKRIMKKKWSVSDDLGLRSLLIVIQKPTHTKSDTSIVARLHSQSGFALYIRRREGGGGVVIPFLGIHNVISLWLPQVEMQSCARGI